MKANRRALRPLLRYLSIPLSIILVCFVIFPLQEHGEQGGIDKSSGEIELELKDDGAASDALRSAGVVVGVENKNRTLEVVRLAASQHPVDLLHGTRTD